MTLTMCLRHSLSIMGERPQSQRLGEIHFGSAVSIDSIGSRGQTEFVDDQSSSTYLTGRKSVHNLESLTLLELTQWSSLGSAIEKYRAAG